jgi:HK97 family phage portal protein
MIVDALSAFFRGCAESIDPIHPKDPALARLFGLGNTTQSGVRMDEHKVMALPAVIRGVNVVSNGLMKLPFYVFRETTDGRTWDKSHVSWTAVSRKPNQDFTANVFRQTMTATAMIWGNAVAYIDRPNWPDGPVELIPLLPDRTQPVRLRGGGAETDLEATGELHYATRIADKPFLFPASQCVHIRGLGPNPYWGYNIADLLMETFGGASAAAEFGHRFFGQGANPAGFVEMPSGLDEEAEERFIDSLKQASSGLSKSHKLAVLEEGSKFHPWTIAPEQAQFLETKQFDVRLIAMAIGVKVHKLMDSANTSYSSLEQSNQEHKDDDLMPWIVRWRDELSDKLLTEDEKESGSRSIDTDDELLSWVSFMDRANGVVSLYNNGLIDKEEGRRKVNFGPSKSEDGKRFRKPTNIGWEDEHEPEPVVQVPPEPPGSADDESDQTAATVHTLAESILAHHARRLGRQARDAAARSPSDFVAWVDGIECPSDVPDVLRAAVGVLAGQYKLTLCRMLETVTADRLVKEVAEQVAILEQQLPPELAGEFSHERAAA